MPYRQVDESRDLGGGVRGGLAGVPVALLALVLGAATAAEVAARPVPFTTPTAISATADGPISAQAADLDRDGDLDVVVALKNDDEIAWFENTGGGSFGGQQTISTAVDDPFSVFAADIDGDGDGDQDLVSASGLDDMIAWYSNRGGQFALPTTSLAQQVAADSQELVLFRVDLEHRGRAGDSGVELATIELRYEDRAEGSPVPIPPRPSRPSISPRRAVPPGMPWCRRRET